MSLGHATEDENSESKMHFGLRKQHLMAVHSLFTKEQNYDENICFQTHSY
jgi:hypothetical protein